MDHNMIKGIPLDQIITYARIVVDYFAQKEDYNRVQTASGGNLIEYPEELTTITVNLITTKIVWNSVLNREDIK